MRAAVSLSAARDGEMAAMAKTYQIPMDILAWISSHFLATGNEWRLVDSMAESR